ncbi:MAG: hypothetical protein CL534_04260 [Ahrensia sp.]|nr:hypothetical protein [Ahrensia sp.]
MIVESDVKVEMRDGTRLSVRISRPDTDAPVPALLAVSPYQHVTDGLPHSAMFLWHEVGPVEWYVENGYAYVHADVRGTGLSEGTFRFLDKAEQKDLYDLVEWIGAQAWCVGAVGGIGQSYYAWSQWWMGAVNPPSLRCIAPYDGSVDLYRDAVYHGGIYSEFQVWWFNMLRVNNQHGPLGVAPGRSQDHDLARDIIAHQYYDEFWKERSVYERLSDIEVPVLSIGHWGKMGLHLRGNLVGFEELDTPKWLMVTRSRDVFEAHELFDEIAFHEKYLLPFYDRFLKGEENGFERSTPKVRLEVSDGGTLEADAWPLPEAKAKSLYLAGGTSGSVQSLNDGVLSDAAPSDEAAATSYSYPDPEWKLGVVKVGPNGPDPVARVLTFTTPPLEEDLVVAGSATLDLFLSTTAPDADVIVKVSDQAPARGEGQPPSQIVARGWLRLSHRERDTERSRPHRPFYKHAAPGPVEAGEVYKVEVEIFSFAHRFPKGHRIRLEIVNGDSALTDSIFTHQYAWWKVGTDTIHHDAGHPSRLSLSVVEDA